ncbi:MAG: PIN domain nuclease [Nitrospira sp.]|nr:MAG: PIN domain nuclease [Nitrospira sp.]
MYLVDTSVWLDFFRNRRSAAVVRFETLLDQGIPFGISGLIYQEVLQGAASEEDFSSLAAYLGTQKFYHPFDPIESYRKAAGLYVRCRRRGVTIRSTADCLVAQIAIEHRLTLLHHDRDYVHMATVVNDLKLAPSAEA